MSTTIALLVGAMLGATTMIFTLSLMAAGHDEELREEAEREAAERLRQELARQREAVNDHGKE